GRFAAVPTGGPDLADLVGDREVVAGQALGRTADPSHSDVDEVRLEVEAATVTPGGVEVVVVGPAGRPQVAVCRGAVPFGRVDRGRADPVARFGRGPGRPRLGPTGRRPAHDQQDGDQCRRRGPAAPA